jgi:hypothetical protein
MKLLALMFLLGSLTVFAQEQGAVDCDGQRVVTKGDEAAVTETAEETTVKDDE